MGSNDISANKTTIRMRHNLRWAWPGPCLHRLARSQTRRRTCGTGGGFSRQDQDDTRPRKLQPRGPFCVRLQPRLLKHCTSTFACLPQLGIRHTRANFTSFVGCEQIRRLLDLCRRQKYQAASSIVRHKEPMALTSKRREKDIPRIVHADKVPDAAPIRALVEPRLLCAASKGKTSPIPTPQQPQRTQGELWP